MKKHHLVYKITNTVNNKFYIGVHSTDNIDDGYMGSGTNIKLAIKQHGLDNFTREILHYYEKREDAMKKEAELVNKDTLKDELCYNIALGGKGGYAIYYRGARDIETKLENRYDEVYKYNISINEEETKKYIEKIDKILLISKAVNKRALRYELSKTFITKLFPAMVNDLTKLYNNKFRHPIAMKFLKECIRWDFIAFIKIEKEKWDKNNEVTTSNA